MITFLVFLPFLLGFVVVAVYGERKVAAFVQNRLGPMEVGPKGVIQTVADLLKMLQKEDIVPKAVDRILFLTAPIIVFAAIFTGYAVLPLTEGVDGAGVDAGVFFLLAVVSLDVLGILLAGWGSNNKFAIYGSIRSVAQIISYEIPLGLSVLAVVMVAQSLDLQEIVIQQGVMSTDQSFLLGIPSIDITAIGGILSWNVFRMPILFIAFIIFFISSLAESNRVPFDLPESESELIGGYHTEYSGFQMGAFYAFRIRNDALSVLSCGDTVFWWMVFAIAKYWFFQIGGNDQWCCLGCFLACKQSYVFHFYPNDGALDLSSSAG